MNGYCNMCGKCCEAITLWVSPDELQLRSNEPERSDVGWGARHFHPISQEEAFARNPLHKMIYEAGRSGYESVHFYECDAFDKETRRCTQHDRRPSTCWGYPHYGGQVNKLPGNWTPYSATCDYIHDIPPAMKQEWIAVAEELQKV